MGIPTITFKLFPKKILSESFGKKSSEGELNERHRERPEIESKLLLSPPKEILQRPDCSFAALCRQPVSGPALPSSSFGRQAALQSQV